MLNVIAMADIIPDAYTNIIGVQMPGQIEPPTNWCWTFLLKHAQMGKGFICFL